MQYIDLLGDFINTTNLEIFVNAFFSNLDVSEIEKRESSNYVEGYYFKAKKGNIFYRICIADEEDNEDLPFWIQISSDILSMEQLVSEVDLYVRHKLLPVGFRFARMIDFGMINEERIDY